MAMTARLPKKQYLDLLLLVDEQKSMIDQYLERGSMSMSTLFSSVENN